MSALRNTNSYSCLTLTDHHVDSKRRLIETMDALQRPYPVRAEGMASQRSSYPSTVGRARSPLANGGIDHDMVSSDHALFRYPVPDKRRRSEHSMADRPISLDVLFIKVLHKIFPQLGAEIISRELALYGNDLTKTVEFMLRKYQSALEEPYQGTVQSTVAEHTYLRQGYTHPPQSPRAYSRESSPSSGHSGYSPGPPQLYTPVVYPSDVKYEQKIHDDHYKNEPAHRFERRSREEMSEENGHPRGKHYQGGVLSYEEALHISALKNRENAMKMRSQPTMNGQGYPGISEDQSDVENQEQNVTSSNGIHSRTIVSSHSQE